MAASCAQGSQARLYVEPGDSPHVFDGSSETYEFLYETLQKRGTIVGGNGIRGTRSAHSIRTREGAFEVGGRIAMNVDAASLDLWLPRMLGAAESSDVFALAESLPAFGVLVDKVTEKFEYKDCKVARWMLHGKAGPGDGDPDLLQLIVEIVGLNRVTGTSVPAVSLSTATNTSPYVHSDCVFTFNSAARQVKEWWVLGDNHLHQRRNNSLAATLLCPMDRTVAVRALLPYDSDTSNLLDQSVAGATGTIAITNAANTGLTTTLTFGVLQLPKGGDPVVRGKTEINLEIDMIARMVSTTRELSINNDSVA